MGHNTWGQARQHNHPAQAWMQLADWLLAAFLALSVQHHLQRQHRQPLTVLYAYKTASAERLSLHVAPEVLLVCHTQLYKVYISNMELLK